MPWYAVVSFAAYTVALIWQTTMAVEIGLGGLLFIPYLLIKLSVMLVAIAYWEHDVCVLLIDHVGAGIVFAGSLVLLGEALRTLKPILVTPNRPPREDDIHVAVGLLTAVALPAVALFFACSVVLGHRCAI